MQPVNSSSISDQVTTTVQKKTADAAKNPANMETSDNRGRASKRSDDIVRLSSSARSDQWTAKQSMRSTSVSMAEKDALLHISGGMMSFSVSI